eukprot:s2287_g11.t1
MLSFVIFVDLQPTAVFTAFQAWHATACYGMPLDSGFSCVFANLKGMPSVTLESNTSERNKTQNHRARDGVASGAGLSLIAVIAESRAGAMSQLSPAAEPFSNLAGSVLMRAAIFSEATSHFVCVLECFFKMREYQEGTADGATLHLNAQYQAEIASKCATELAAYFQSLWGTVIHLQHKVQELEDWKKKALEDVRKLRDEHKTLRRKVMGDEPVELGTQTELQNELCSH